MTGTPDSLDYLVAARSWLATGRPLDTGGRPFTQFAPGYPGALAAFGRSGVGLLTAARLVATAAMVVTALAAWLWTRHITGSSRAAVVGAIAAVSLWPVWTAAHAWSEPLLIAFSLVGGAALAAAIARRSRPLAFAAGILVGLAASTRYAGLVFVLLAVPVFVHWVGPWRERCLAACSFMLPITVIGGAPVLFNLTVDGSQPFGQRVPADASILDVVAQAITGLVKLAAPPSAPGLVAVGSFGVLAVVTARTVRSLRGRRHSDWWHRVALPVWFAGLYVFATVAGAVGSRLDGLDDGRLLAPCGPLLTVALVGLHAPAVAVAGERGALPRSFTRWVPNIALAVGVVLAARNVVSDGVALRPQGLLSPAVVRSDVLTAAAATDAPLIVSNSPGVVAWALDRTVVAPPRRGAGRVAERVAGRVADGWPPGTLLVWMDVGLVDVADLGDLAVVCDLDDRADLAGGRLLVIARCA